MTDRERLKCRLKSSEQKYFDDIIGVVDCFKRVTGREVNYSTLGSLKLILFWLKQGYGVPQFGAVFDYKHRQFKDNPEMRKYIAIDTFCRQEKFENSLERARQEWIDKQKEKKEAIMPYHRKIGDIAAGLASKKST
jgi:uncharacterized phage protein (TIGR02220 family)